MTQLMQTYSKIQKRILPQVLKKLHLQFFNYSMYRIFRFCVYVHLSIKCTFSQSYLGIKRTSQAFFKNYFLVIAFYELGINFSGIWFVDKPRKSKTTQRLRLRFPSALFRRQIHKAGQMLLIFTQNFNLHQNLIYNCLAGFP